MNTDVKIAGEHRSSLLQPSHQTKLHPRANQ
ncbi:BnaCnng47810D [Brassica napus]|uniref:BnaCnng47810D protein n=1 Tax=Brassica napus TaxID=3708 RepID=A0A078JD81_BRANA|nr:BnaCnng47810D [Brassica napus]